MTVRNTCCALLLGCALIPLIIACDKWENETVESTYQGIITPDPTYNFKRAGNSSVDILECKLLKEAVDLTYRHLHEANFTNEELYKLARGYYENGEFGLKPQEEIATSSQHEANRALLLAEVENIFTKSCELSGYGKPNASMIRNTPAEEGKGG